ncbi:MAG: GDSL-type esterase/lipase family protein [Saccharofermentans sp.]|jgi:lysophospholipase L1-like esterase|nr:GDSL-type esterase/lipase family protein [Mageeibacillus sp.]MCI1264106.1 GDSL-type esterase/lipase family protein [Saccharofermentans sp.]MCI1274831.1 GDSL-type esterase/lipase family protein [Saccharofermentans sp.]
MNKAAGSVKRILCYGDSNTFGLIPASADRYPESIRWTSRLQKDLGDDYLVFEEGRCGRTTCFEDLRRPGLNGLAVLPSVLRTYQTLDYTVIMLGTNDCKSAYHAKIEMLTDAISRMAGIIRERDSQCRIIIMSPAPLADDVALLDKEFDDTSARFSQGLRIAYRILCSTNGYHFLDAGMFGSASPLDGQHLEAGSHRHLALILADCIRRDANTAAL